MRQLYNAVAIPKMTYAADVWYTPVNKRVGRLRSSSSVGIMGKLASLQWMATLAITGALRSTATNTLDLHADVLPVKFLLQNICHRAILRMASLPPSHPLHKPVLTRAKRYIMSHCSPLHELAHIFGIAPQDLETITPTSSLPNCQLKCKMVIHGSAEESEAYAMDCQSELIIYSDGSGIGGRRGAATVLCKAGCSLKTLRLHLGSLEEHTTFKAEVASLSLALHLLSLKRNACSTTILLDNQAVIQSLEHRETRSAQYLLDELTHQIGTIYRQARHLDFELCVAWVKGHVEIEGNELADAVAKAAAGGESSMASSLLRLLTSLLPVSITAQKQAFMASLHEQWGEAWR